ncbi:hypothetical protein D3C75_1365230 [compost metagenome]
MAGFSAGFITGALHDATHSYLAPMMVVGGFMLLSALLMLVLSRIPHTRAAKDVNLNRAGEH